MTELLSQFWSIGVACVVAFAIMYAVVNKDIPQIQKEIRSLQINQSKMSEQMTRASISIEVHGTLLTEMKDDLKEIRRSLSNGHGHS